MQQKDVIYQREDVVVAFIVGCGIGLSACAVIIVLLMQALQAVNL